jgi:hypothetical protein
MTSDFLIQALIFLEVFVMGMLVAIAARHAFAHFKLFGHEPEKPTLPLLPSEPLPDAVKERLFHASQAEFQAVLSQFADTLQHDLSATTKQVDNLVKQLATEIVGDELERYRMQLGKLHEQAEVDMGSIRAELDSHKAELKAKMTGELEAEKQRLVKQIDTKLADAVGSFLQEALQHNIDLGEQSAYLVSVLEEHKADFIKEVADEAEPAR